jgi:DNA polymerase elongation subunit (family B)
MSVSLKAIVPSQLSKKSLFPTNRIDESHIYCISYTYCDDYLVELKPPKYNSYQKTFYLKEFGKMNELNFVQCDNEKQMIAQFLSDVYFYDPDVLICHDSARIIDVLIQRLMQINDKNDKPRIGRLIHFPSLSITNQNSRISNAIAGRLLVDTFVHSKDMIKSIDYEL